MPSGVVSSWGNIVEGRHELLSLASRFAPMPELPPEHHLLPFGNGRSYGDSCLNVGEALLRMRNLDRFIRFDADNGVLECEAGVLLSEIHALTLPAGWFLPVVPGTQFVTVGGAIANDVHGKNHHRAGTFGRHVRRFELLLSSGARLTCSPQQNADYFRATIGGLGLTGAITSAEISLRRVPGPWMDVETIRFANLAEFFTLSAESDAGFEYTVSWIDCLARGAKLGRGILQRANHIDARDRPAPARKRSRSMPFVPPVSLVNPLSLRAFNTIHYAKQPAGKVRTTSYYEPFFFPLDNILHWNRLYGKRGFYQYQCVVPGSAAPGAIRELLQIIAHRGIGSFLGVLKHCGALESPGLLSFPQQGVSLALDFPNQGEKVARLFASLDAIIRSAGGRLYPAKDCRMPGDLFRSGYPRWQEFSKFVDPGFSSTFWRRVTADA